MGCENYNLSDFLFLLKIVEHHRIQSKELLDIIKQLVKCYSLLQKCNITHRDVKPQNILIMNNSYKICDFGEAMVTHGKNGFIHQPIRGSGLYMSPVLFQALNNRKKDVIHNTYKSDVFSFGLCSLFAATLGFNSLYDIRELKNNISIFVVVEKYLRFKYSDSVVNIISKMLDLNEHSRCDFIQLEKEFNNIGYY